MKICDVSKNVLHHFPRCISSQMPTFPLEMRVIEGQLSRYFKSLLCEPDRLKKEIDGLNRKDKKHKENLGSLREQLAVANTIVTTMESFKKEFWISLIDFLHWKIQEVLNTNDFFWSLRKSSEFRSYFETFSNEILEKAVKVLYLQSNENDEKSFNLLEANMIRFFVVMKRVRDFIGDYNLIDTFDDLFLLPIHTSMLPIGQANRMSYLDGKEWLSLNFWGS